MGCCEPMLGPIENYYTKPATDRRIQEEISGISAVTIDEVQEMIDESISGITVSGVTEEELNEAIASAKTQIEAEIPIVPTKVSAFENDVPYLTEHQSLSGYATEQWVEDKHYITGVDLSDYALKSEIPVVPTSNTAFTNDAGYITGVDLSNYATTGDVANVSTALTAHSSDTTIHVTPEQVVNWDLKANVWCGSEADWALISGGTLDPQCIYLVY